MNSFFGWIGGKKLLRKEITERFPESFGRYIEVFGGAGWVLFFKEKHANFEVYNDANSDLVNLFRCVKYHTPELLRELNYSLNSREFFIDFIEQYNVRGLTDIQRAARFFMIIKTSYGSDTRSFGCIKKDINNAIQYLSSIEKRLSKVVIENKDFESLIKVYDREDALFYLDPPYYGTEKYYQISFATDDHTRLCNKLKNIKGKFILSYNDCDFIRDLYKEFKIEETDRNNSLRSKSAEADKRYKELIITNF